MPFRVYYPDTPPLPLPPGHRFPAAKYGLLHAAVIARGILAPGHLVAAPPAGVADLTRAHDPAYVSDVIEGRLPRAIETRIGLPWSEVLVARSRATVGGTLAAARDALAAGISGQLAGGTHHARREGGAGFCVFNDCAVAILTLLSEGAISRAAILDLDVHHGDGNAAILGNVPGVFVASVHGANNYPFDKPPSSLDIALPDGAGDESYLAACARALDAVLGSKPHLALYIAGVDPLETDRLGRLAVSRDGLLTRDRRVLEACRKAAVPVAVVIGGGYSEPIEHTVAAYANTWQAAREVFG